jgi:hypothetical protein
MRETAIEETPFLISAISRQKWCARNAHFESNQIE